MPQYYSPGVYIEEVDTGPQPIEGVATAVAAFVGFAPYSSHEDANRPVLVTSWSQYVEKFGLPDKYGRREPYMPDAYLSHAVFGFFQNGGSRCYVVRVIPGEQKLFQERKPEAITIPSLKDKNKPVLKIVPKPGSIGKDIQITIGPKPGSRPEDGAFTVRVRMGELEEKPLDVALPKPTDTQPSAQTQPASTQSMASNPSKKSDSASQQSKEEQKASDEGAAAGSGKEQPQSNGNSQGAASSNPPVNVQDLLKESNLIELLELDPKSEIASRMPIFGTYTIAVPQPESTELATIKPHTVVGDITERSGVAGLEIADDVTMVCCPDLMSPLFHGNQKPADLKQDSDAKIRIESVHMAMIAHAELAGDRIAILDAPHDRDAQEIAQWRQEAGYDSMYAALYYPWITIANPLAGDKGGSLTIDVPPCGHIAGIYARNDMTRGVHKAPANEVVRGVLKPARDLTTGEQDGLNPIGVNCIRTFPGRSAVVWGARTLSSSKPAWRYINVRRLFNYVEKSIERGTQWVVFEPNDPDLWSRVRRDVSAFLMTLWRDGMLFGTTPQEAFRVKCDEELNPPESRDQGRLVIEVGLAPIKPAEFVIFRFSQLAGGGQ